MRPPSLLWTLLLAVSSFTVLAIRPIVPLTKEVLTDTSSGALGISLVEPLPASTKLKINPAGLAALKELDAPIAPVVVIGPYRSGKSFLVNQMLQQSCDAGMVVGHRRETQTRGVWLWKNAVPVDAGGGKPAVNLVFFDTEGFESTGQSDAYDDRIFAFAAVIASTLIYNLAEAVRESDIEKLSFAVEVANAFYPSSTENKSSEKALDPIHMVWVIQRDFLQGKSTQTAVDEALVAVPNPNHETSIDQVNDIRRSLAVLARDSSAFGLPQPHLNRTGLCDMPESSFDPRYLEARDQLRAHLHNSARGKRLGGKLLDGAGLAELVESLVQALNEREMPTAGSMLEAFNQQLVVQCGDQHAAALASIRLPTEMEDILSTHKAAAADVMEQLHQGAFGRIGERLDGKLQSALDRNLQDTLNKNEILSTRTCDALETSCEVSLERLEKMSLPSLGRFDAKAAQCMKTFDNGCTGPARQHLLERLQHAHSRERTRFQQEYNNRLYNGLTMAALATALLCRFVFKQIIPEMVGWVAFVFLEAYPKMTVGMTNMYDSQWWQRLISVWEVLIYNPIMDLEAAWLPLLVLVSASCGYRWWHRRRGRRNRKHLHEGERDLNV